MKPKKDYGKFHLIKNYSMINITKKDLFKIKLTLVNKIIKYFKRKSLYLLGSCYYSYKCGLFPIKNTIYTHIEYNIGDNLAHLHLLKKIAILNPCIKFIHFMKPEYIKELYPYICEIENIKLMSIWFRPFYSNNSWKNYKNYWDKRDKNDKSYTNFYTNYFDLLCKRLNLINPIKNNNDFIFDNPFKVCNANYKEYDFLIVNSEPLSDQFNYNEKQLDILILDIASQYSVITTKKVVGIACTADQFFNLNQIANQSINCKYHIMIATGPCWLVLNKYNCENSKGIYMLVEIEYINFSNNMQSFKSIDELRERLYQNKILINY